ncbi:MAG: molecular chaperone HtpG [Candidatus Heimdallarchaeota archaeon]|nr:molecular chaperone HtpG [Candidatus Heimdallarchaeota archaeon]MDH5645556.1 molecular chaperone HtpG [Candidatus Heimdallarchaeota archaeon]
MTATSEKSYQFKAQTQKLLKIIINSLYQHKEVFLRELVSNSSDALNKIRIKQLMSEKILDNDVELSIKLIPDKEAKTITIIDTGIGMTQKELVENLGTIAQSGTEQFLQEFEQTNDDSLIGRFGVGFYSAFLVANKVEVNTRSFSQNSKAWRWISEGIESYTIEESDKTTRGTEIVLYLNEDDESFLEDYELKSLIKKYSNYVAFPIILGEDTINEQTALWRVSPKEVTDEQYKEFYNQIGQFGDPQLKIHISTDSPYEFFSILYVPKSRPLSWSGEKEWGLKLYNRKILINDKNKDFLPEYLRFIIGVLDSEDLDLNVSREVLQNTRVQRAIFKYLHKKVIEEFETLAKDDEEKYLEFFKEYGGFLKEGVSANDKHKDKLIDLIRFHTTSDEGQNGSVSLADYITRMKPDQKEIYYLTGLELDLLKSSPHLEYYKKEGYEVLLLGEPIDSFLMMHLLEYHEKKFFLIDQDESIEEDKHEEKDEEDEEEDEPKIKEGPFAPILNRFVSVLAGKVNDVKTSDRMVDSVARLVTPKGGINSNMQRAMKIWESQGNNPGMNFGMTGKVLQINPNHSIIKSLNDIIQNNEEDERIDIIINQIHDNARISEGDIPDFNELLDRSEKIISHALKK